MISSLTWSSLSRFPPCHYFLAVASSVALFSSLLQRLRCNARPISYYPLTCRRFFTSGTFHPTARTPFLLSEGHWNRIKLYAGFSMPPFPPVAMKGGIRHDGRSSRRKMGRSRLNEVGRNFLGLLSNGLMQNDDGEKETFAIGLIAAKAGKRAMDEKKRFNRRREQSYTSHCCLPYSRLSRKMNVFGLLLPVMLLICFIYIVAASSGCA